MAGCLHTLQVVGGSVLTVAPQIWQFSARDPKVAEQLARYVGERVQLHYTEHVGIPSNCFGETRYFVDRVSLAPGPGTSPMLPAPAATPGPTVVPAPVSVPADAPAR